MKRILHSRKVAFMVLLIAFALVAAACSSDPDVGDTTTTAAPPADTTTTTEAPPETTTTTEAPLVRPYGGEVIVADDQEPPTLNSFAPGGDNFIVSIIGQSYWAGVQEIDGFTLELIPELVTELPTVANGGVTVNDDDTMTVKYQIRDDAQWEDGTPITGNDFQFTYDIIMNPDLPINKSTYEDIDPDSVIVGEKTFEYTLTAPTVLFDLLFGTILPAHAIDPATFMEDWNDKMWPSAGPFVFDEWAQGEFVRVVRNDNYWKTDPETGQQLPYLDSVTFKFIPETEAIITAFKAREIDIIQPPPSSETIETLQALEAEGARVEVLSGPVWEHLNFQFGPKRFDRNPNSCNESFNMRAAIAHTINKKVLTDEILAGQVEPLDSYIEAFAPALSNQAWAQYQPDVAKATEFYAAALEETGKECSVVFSTTSNNDARVQMSELFVGMFETTGIPYENDLVDSSVFFGEVLDTGTWDLGEWAWVGSPGLSGLVNIHDLFDPEQPPPLGQNYYRWGTSELADEEYEGDNAVYAGTNESSVKDAASERYAVVRDEMNATVDDGELVALIQEAEAILADNLVIFPLYARLVTAAVWADEVGNFKHNPTVASHTWNLELWYRVDLEG
ncbi:MAG: ABC transporter substrate-binding protein [Actinomycetota bacterium]|nr:ABC transporter substrate-binding protein [Actinomycetota bacterium]